MLPSTHGQRVFLSFTLAALVFVGPWLELAKGSFFTHFRGTPFEHAFLPVLACQTLLGLILFAAGSSIPRQRLALPAAVAGIFFLPWVAYDSLTHIFDVWIFWLVDRFELKLALVLLLVAALAAAWFWTSRTLATLAFLYTLAGFPMAVITLHASWRVLITPTAVFADRPPLDFLQQGHPPQRRLIWILFDEMNASNLWDKPPAGVPLPNFTRLRAESFWATDAKAAGPHTDQALPGLLTGIPVASAVRHAVDDILLYQSVNAAPKNWKHLSNVFDEARKVFADQGAAAKVALAGWYHPYGRVLSLHDCVWTGYSVPDGLPEVPYSKPFLTRMRGVLEAQARSMAEMTGVPGFDPQAHLRSVREENLRYVRDHALRLAADPSVGLALLHLPVPHPPGIVPNPSLRLPSYMDNLVLADHILGEIRAAIHQAGLRDRTTLLVSADHPLRVALWKRRSQFLREEIRFFEQNRDDRIPFLLRLPAQPHELAYRRPLDTIVSKRLVLAILRGDLESPPQVEAWLQRAHFAR